MPENIIGISGYFHDSACCILQDGKLVAAAEEERFSRRKHDARIPSHAFNYCLREAGIGIGDIDCISFYEVPWEKASRQLWMLVDAEHRAPQILAALKPGQIEYEIRSILGYDGPVEFVPHHRSHAASTFYCSGFEEAAVLTVDGVGEWATTTYGYAADQEIALFEQVDYPDSLGLLYSTVTNYLGFSVNEGEYKVMGAAAYGSPRYAQQLANLISSEADGQFRLNLRYFDFEATDRMHSPAMIDLLGFPPREHKAPLTQEHMDLARSTQSILEEILVEKTAYLQKRTGSANLCMAGGVALNCVANSLIRLTGKFKKLFVQPAAGDAGACIGAAIEVARKTHSHLGVELSHVQLGPSYDTADICRMLDSAGLDRRDFRGRESDLLQVTAEKLAKGAVVGWFHGRMEFGPRALGARSILADPRDARMRDRLNVAVKKREPFRPFAPAVLLEDVPKYFSLDHASPFMLETWPVLPTASLPAITHVDGTARIQTVDERTQPRFAKLLAAFRSITGCGVLVNTSFNLSDEPIVCSPLDALVCFIRSEMDVLVLEDVMIERAMLRPSSEMLLRNAKVSDPSAITYSTYTFL